MLAGPVEKGYDAGDRACGCAAGYSAGTAFVRDAVVIAYIVNETISIIENAGLMGLPVPDVIMQAIEQLQGKNDQK